MFGERPPMIEEGGNFMTDEPAAVTSASGQAHFAEELVARGPSRAADAPPRITVLEQGPLVVQGAPAVVDYLGCDVAIDGVVAFCRCGRSADKPRCDASCWAGSVPFEDTKVPNRVPDRRDTFIGQQVTVLDNRGVCQHSGLCTDRLSSVFHAGGDSFVSPSGGRMDEVIRAVRDCPSGALSFALDGIEARGQVDWGNARNPRIEITQDGPYRVTGDVELTGEHGQPVARNEGSSMEHFALCRCGHSQNKPFCSGMHYYVNFRDPASVSDTAPSIFEWAGGLPALLRMTRIFYERYVPADELLGPLFANMSADHPQRVAQWLGEVFGGPSMYSDAHGGYTRMLSQHRGRALREEQRARWVQLLTRSAADAGLPNDPEFRSAFGAYLEWGSRLAVENSQVDSRPPGRMPMPHWSWSTAAGPPGSRISALSPNTDDHDLPLTVPAADEPVRFDKHIKPMFRSSDRTSMTFAFDLWQYADVHHHAAAIEARLQAGTMPCDGAWPAEKIAIFSRWVEEGANP